jgi:hypothetical protein
MLARIWLKARALCASSSASDFQIIWLRPVGEVEHAAMKVADKTIAISNLNVFETIETPEIMAGL